MDFAGKTNPIAFDNVPDFRTGALVAGLQQASSYRYYCRYYYALQTVMGEGISS